jgi:hypothetical protein
MRAPSVGRPSATLVALALALSGCGGDDKDDETQRPATSPASAAPQAFPPAGGRSLAQIRAGLPSGPILAPGVGVLAPGTNRFGFALFNADRTQITGAQTALYIADQNGANARGPIPARSESLAVDPRFASRTTSSDPGSGKAVYVAQLPLGAARTQVVMALVRAGDRLVASSDLPLELGRPGPIAVGARAPRVNTPTSPPSPPQAIDTRVPPSSMHDVNLADVLGRRPVFLVFATPALCQSRICGPTVDEAEQLKARYGSRMAFIHMEVYNDNRLENGFRPQLRAYGLPTEPWVFAIDRRGRVAARLEGAASVAEMQQAIEKALRA